jgi:uncharacterized protein YciI
MITLAFCRDSGEARVERPRWFGPHMQHLRTVIGSIRLAAPLAIADGAGVSGGEGLVASVFAIEAPTLSAAAQVMRADPYLQGGVWERIALFNVVGGYGEWVTSSAPRSVPKKLYVVFRACLDASRTPAADEGFAAHRRYMSELETPAIFGAQLVAGGSLGNATGNDRWHSVAFVAAESLERAKAIALADPSLVNQPAQPQVYALPMSVGSWTGNTNI